MSEFWYACFITDMSEYCLIDAGGDVRATAPDLEGILVARKHYGWGVVRRCKYRGGVLNVGRRVNV